MTVVLVDADAHVHFFLLLMRGVRTKLHDYKKIKNEIKPGCEPSQVIGPPVISRSKLIIVVSVVQALNCSTSSAMVLVDAFSLVLR